MKFKDLKIGTQLFVGFGTMIALVIVLSVVSYQQSNRLREQTDLIYNHPLKVQRSLGTLTSDILNIHLGLRDLMISSKDDEKQMAIQLMKTSEADALHQFDVLRMNYLGPQKDIEEAFRFFVKWNAARDENQKLLEAGQVEKVRINLATSGSFGIIRTQMMKEIGDIYEFATKKSDFLYDNSAKIKDLLNLQLFIIVITILFLILIISYFLIRNIRNPIQNIAEVTKKFQEGDLNARSVIDSRNEFGQLSLSFNNMVESIKQNFELNEKTNKLVNSMLAVDNSHTFFREMLPVLSELTNSQMAAVYLLNEENTHFYHYESVGLASEAAKLTFSANSYEGEFGKAVSSREIQYVKSIPIDTPFTYQTVSGKYVPREIITIPIEADNEIVAIISLASLRKYSEESHKLITSIFDILTARIEGILVYRQARKITKKLELQNTELEAQKSELATQSVELKEQNRELEIQKNQLNEANRLKTNFLSNMSHELRTPLNSVIALSGVLSRRLSNKIGADEFSYLEVIERNGKHLLSLINDVLDISRIEAGHEEVEISKFSSENMIAELITMIQPQAHQKNIELIQKENNHNVFINSDIHKCRHIMQNLIANAVKFTEKGKVEIEVIQKTETVEISVTDTGIGIPLHHMAHIFDEFRQADSSTSRRYGGTGLGLAIAKKYANLLGGNIFVTSTPEEGSVFTLTLPINFCEENRIIDEPVMRYEKPFISTIQNSSNHKKTVLLVDDSEPAIIQMKDFLIESGYKILTAHNGEEALEVISKIIPDAMILDLMMPGIDGFEVLQTIREAEPTAHIPVLILTAKHITKEDLNFLKRNNVHQLIQKGDVNRVELLQAIASLVFKEEIETLKPKNILPKISGKPNVLVVEDNPDNMTTVKAILGDKFNILEAINGQDGINLAKEHVPHLILMDIALPEIDGIEAFKTIRRDGKLEHIPVIALTASAMTSERETILSHGFDAYIAKPIDDKNFFDTINKVLYGK